MRYCHSFLFLLVLSAPLSAYSSSFHACHLKVELEEASEQLQSNSDGGGMSLELTFTASEMTEGDCSEMVGKKLTKDVTFSNKDSLYALQVKAKENGSVELDHSLYSGDDKSGEDFVIETWTLIDDNTNFRSEGDDGRY